MNVTFLNIGDFGGGAAKAAYRLFSGMKNFHQQDGSVRFVTLEKKLPDEDVYPLAVFKEEKNRFEKIVSRINRTVTSRFRNYHRNKYPDRKQAYIPDLYFSELASALPNLEFDILHLHWVFGDFVNFKELQKINKPIVWTIHDCLAFTGICYYTGNCEKYQSECGACPVLQSSSDNDLSTSVFRTKMKRYAKLNLHIVSPSNWLAEKARESALLGNKPVYVIPNGIDTEFFKPVEKKQARKALGLDPGKRQILFGAIRIEGEKRKGYDELKKVLKILDGKIEDDVEFMILGADYSGNDHYSFKTNYLGYIGDETKLVNAYSAADVMMFPSLEENLSNMIMEASACGTPTVAFHIGGNCDMITHRASGYLSAENDPQDFADGVLWCLANNESNRLGKKARDRVINNFAIEKITSRYWSLYQKIR